MICEVGMPAYPASESKAFLTDIIKKTRSVSGGKGLGVFYWEPQCYNWAGYGKGAWYNDGRPSVALDAFLEGVIPTPTPTSSPTPTPTTTYSSGLPGDVNGDGYVDSLDLSIFKRYILRKIDNLPVADAKRAADLNEDGYIDSTDVTILKRYLLRKIKALPYVV